ncbi:hypothetical protein ACA758_04515 [Mycoplasmopsis agassizii]|uniref:hypothetical protein n=1 Tax=Mycoplasmopsis agassizii TaxID=33922 RepID=UPI00352811EB
MASSIFVIFTSSLAIGLVSLKRTAYHPEPFDDKSILKGSGLFDKKTQDNKNYLQLNTWNFMDFTFSDFQWIFEGVWTNGKIEKVRKDINPHTISDKVIKASWLKKVQGSDRFIKFIKKFKWSYEPELPNNAVDVQDSRYIDSGYIHDFSDQKNYPNHLKSISLIKNDGELKQALRLEDQDREKYLKYFRSLEDYFYWYKKEKLSDEELSKKYLPWTDTFNFDTVNSKMDFKNYDYLFVKDLRSSYGDGNVGIGDLSKGIKIHSYKIEPENHKLKIMFWYDEEVRGCHNCMADDAWDHSWTWKRLSSMLIPIEKNKISEFNMNNWNLDIEGYEYIPYGRW